MTKQEFILTFISVAIFLVLLVPTLIYKIRRERKLPTGEPVPVTQGQRFMALLGDAMWVGLLTLAGWGLFSGATLGYEFNHVDQKSAIEQAIHPAGSALLLGINVGYVLISLVGRLGVSPGTNSRQLAWVDSTGRPAGRGHTFVIGLAFILSILGKTSVGVFASIGGTILFLEAVSVLPTKRGIIGKLMHVNLVDARCITPQPC